MNKNDELLVKIAKFIRDNYKLGDQIIGERLLAKAFNCSRGAIRERIIVLVTLEYLSVKPQGGTYYNREIRL